MTKTFVLGVGAQKAGTTWLHSYLANLPCSNFGFAKEYHVFDALTLADCSGFRQIEEKKAAVSIIDLKKKFRARKKLSFMDNTLNYYAYFESLLQDNGISLTGDITPSYSGLSEDTLSSIQQEFKLRNIDVRVVFLMRDPVMRLQSMVRMSFKRKGKVPILEREISVMKKRLNSPQEQLRGRYDLTIPRLDRVFGDKVFYGFYEDLFNDKTIAKLCEFLEVKYTPADFSKEKNVSRTSNQLGSDDIAYFRQQFSLVYDFCYSRFGRERIEEYWG